MSTTPDPCAVCAHPGVGCGVLTDSVSNEGVRLTTFEVSFHRWILPETNTHRALSKNGRSSRAVPSIHMVNEVRDNPAMPVAWMKNRPGMVASEPMTADEAQKAAAIWRRIAAYVADGVQELIDLGLHKQWASRPLEPYLFTKGVISGTDWNNFFSLRRAPDAQPEFKALADAMFDARQASTPKLLLPGEWHLPYVSQDEIAAHGGLTDPTGILRRMSTARVARVSIKPFDGAAADADKDAQLHDRLLAMRHMSPFEHQATPDQYQKADCYWFDQDLWGNYHGWIQYRHTLPGEHVPG